MKRFCFGLWICALAIITNQSHATPPAAFERMQDPDVEYEIMTDVSYNWYVTQPTNPKMRIVDFEIDEFDPAGDHRVTIVKVPNRGLYETFSFELADLSKFGVDHFIGQGMRIADIELNYHDHYAGFGPDSQARYSVVLVENTGNQFANWAWIESQPEITFWAQLQDYMNMGFRPYDIEVKQWNGEIYGTALLAYNQEGGASPPVETDVFYFNSDDLSLTTLEAMGWQLMDVEKVVGDLQSEWDYFGIFVKSGETHTLNSGVHTFLDTSGVSRIIDLERDGRVSIPEKVSLDLPGKDGWSWVDFIYPTYITLRLAP